METKYGEIKSIDDLFERIEGTEKDENPERTNEHLAIMTIQFRCKICREIVRDYTDYSAKCAHNLAGKEIHIELHKTLNEIGVKLNQR